MKPVFFVILLCSLVISCNGDKTVKKGNLLHTRLDVPGNTEWCIREFSVHTDSVRRRLKMPVMPDEAVLQQVLMDGCGWYYRPGKGYTDFYLATFFDDLNRKFRYEIGTIQLDSFRSIRYSFGSAARVDSLIQGKLNNYDFKLYFGGVLITDSCLNCTGFSEYNDSSGKKYYKTGGTHKEISVAELDSIMKKHSLVGR
jgi:hypothetical protein